MPDANQLLAGQVAVITGAGSGIGRAEEFGADRIGPQHARAVDRPEPGRQRRGRMHGQPRIADASQLEIRTTHPTGLLLAVTRLV